MLKEMIAEYNHTEAEQRKRLEAIFKALKERSGYRRVRFSNNKIWSNCWTSPEHLAIPAFVDPIIAQIEQIDEGND